MGLMTVQAEVTLKFHQRGLDEVKLRGDAPAVAATILGIVDDRRFGHPNEVKLDIGIRTDGGNFGFVRAYAPPELEGVEVKRETAEAFGVRLLCALGAKVPDPAVAADAEGDDADEEG